MSYPIWGEVTSVDVDSNQACLSVQYLSRDQKNWDPYATAWPSWVHQSRFTAGSKTVQQLSTANLDQSQFTARLDGKTITAVNITLNSASSVEPARTPSPARKKTSGTSQVSNLANQVAGLKVSASPQGNWVRGHVNEVFDTKEVRLEVDYWVPAPSINKDTKWYPIVSSQPKGLPRSKKRNVGETNLTAKSVKMPELRQARDLSFYRFVAFFHTEPKVFKCVTIFCHDSGAPSMSLKDVPPLATSAPLSMLVGGSSTGVTSYPNTTKETSGAKITSGRGRSSSPVARYKARGRVKEVIFDTGQICLDIQGLWDQNGFKAKLPSEPLKWIQPSATTANSLKARDINYAYRTRYKFEGRLTNEDLEEVFIYWQP